MKKLITIMCTGLLTIGLSAQTDQGTFAVILNPGLGFASTTITDIEGIGGVSFGDLYNNKSNSVFNLNLTDFSNILNDVGFGYFVADNILIGLQLGFVSSSDNEEINGGATTKYSNSGTRIGPAFRYYIEAGDMYLFPELTYTMSSSKEVSEMSVGTTTTTNEYEEKSSELSIGFGMSIFLSDYLVLEPKLSYNMLTTTEVDGGYDASGNTVDYVEKASMIMLDINLGLYLGN